jgi:Fe-S-cluster containining protein
VALRKDQQEFDASGTAPESAPERPGSPVITGIPGVAANTSSSGSEGPVFDFSDPGITKPENDLREAAAELKEALQAAAIPSEGAAAYAALRAALDARMPELYRRYEAYVRAVLATGAEKPACSKGCSHCCSHYVTSVEPYELIFLHGRIREDARYPSRIISMHRRAALFSSLLDAEDGEEAEDRALYRYYLRGAPCPFLSEGGGCGVYEARPMSCRMFYSMSHPSLCKGKKVIDPGNRNFLIELPEDIEADLARAGTVFSRYALPESLFEGLLKVNELFGRYDDGGAGGA